MITVEDRFWNKVSKTENCWNWTASVQGKNGYGFFRISKEKGCAVAHRFSYELAYGTIPPGMLVCHTCDNPLCVKPTHLFLGTHKDNAIDREKKNRLKQHGSQKLTDKEVIEIRGSSLSQSALSKAYKVSRTTIASIRKGESWKILLSIL